jgi:hypothetical protein
MQRIASSKPMLGVIAALAALSIGSAAAVSANANYGGSAVAVKSMPAGGCGGSC